MKEPVATNILYASILVRDAVDGRQILFKDDLKSLFSYKLFTHPALKFATVACIFLNLALVIIEDPPLQSIGETLPHWFQIFVPKTLEFICLIYFLHRWLHFRQIHDDAQFWRDKKNIVVIVVIVITFFDIIVHSVVMIAVGESTYNRRWTRVLRPLFLINFVEGRHIRRSFRNIRRTLVDIVNVLIVLVFHWLLFALLSYKLFSARKLHYPDVYPSADNGSYFTNFFSVVWDLYVMLTTANSPDVMCAFVEFYDIFVRMPAYDVNMWYVLFFFAFMVVCYYLLMTIMLAAIYNGYKKHLKDEVMRSVYAKRQKLSRAFDLVKTTALDGAAGSSVPAGVITFDMWTVLMMHVLPGKSDQYWELLFRVLDDKSDFLRSADLLNVGVRELDTSPTFCELRCAALYETRASIALCSAIRHRYFRYGFDFLILLNAVFIGIGWDDTEWYFLAAFTLEICLKLYALGLRAYMSHFWNIFDFVIITGALVLTIVDAHLLAERDVNAVREEAIRQVDVLIMLRVLRLIRIISSIERFRVIMQTIMSIGPSIFTYGTVLFVFYYVFAIIGMEAFAGRIRYQASMVNGTASGVANHASLRFCGDARLNASAFWVARYCGNNFNDVFRSFITLFELMIVNQWHVITNGFVLVTHPAARVYFFAFHFFCVVILLNIFVAFVLEAFILEYNVRGGKFDDLIERKITELGLQPSDSTASSRPDRRGLVCSSDDPAGMGQEYSWGAGGDTVRLSLAVNSFANPSFQPVENNNVASTSAAPLPPETSIEMTPADNETQTSATPASLRRAGRRSQFKLQRRSLKNMEVLLQNMFETELGPTDEGVEERVEMLTDDQLPRHRTRTALDAVI